MRSVVVAGARLIGNGGRTERRGYREAAGLVRRAVAGLPGPDGAVMRLKLAGALIEENRLEEGIGEIRRALTVWPAEAALAHLERGIASTPRKRVLRLALGQAYRRLGSTALRVGAVLLRPRPLIGPRAPRAGPERSPGAAPPCARARRGSRSPLRERAGVGPGAARSGASRCEW